MRHHKHNRIFGRDAGQRRALLRSLAVALITHGHIETTEAKAKELRPFVEPLITHGRKKTLATRRFFARTLGHREKDAAAALANTLGPRYATRPGGYLRIIKLSPRASDGSPMARIEFV